jgi:hypothetical protein
MNKALHIRNRINALMAVVALTEGVDETNFVERFKAATATQADKEEQKEVKYRLSLIEGKGERQTRLLMALLTADKRYPVSLFNLVQMSHGALKSGVGITWTGVSEAIAASTGHPLMYSPSIMPDDVKELGLTSIPEFTSEKKCRKAFPDHAVTKHLKGNW